MWYHTATTLDQTSEYVQWHVKMSAVYTAVCAFRSFMPRIGLERYCVVDHWLSHIAIGRSGATIAEICFGVQIGLLMEEMGVRAGVMWVQDLKWPVIIALSVAQVFCWIGCITLKHAWLTTEETMWTITFIVVGAAFSACAPLLTGTWQNLAYLGIVLCIIFTMFMVISDLPMHIVRGREDDRKGKRFLGI